MGRIKTTIVRGLLVIGFGLAGLHSAVAQTKGVELNGFFGIYGPTDKEGLQGTREALRRGSAAFGGRLTYWTGKAIGIELTGAFATTENPRRNGQRPAGVNRRGVASRNAPVTQQVQRQSG